MDEAIEKAIQELNACLLIRYDSPRAHDGVDANLISGPARRILRKLVADAQRETRLPGPPVNAKDWHKLADALEPKGSFREDGLDAAEAEQRASEEQYAQLEADARRYRKLRDQFEDVGYRVLSIRLGEWEEGVWLYSIDARRTYPTLDAAVDALQEVGS